MTIHWHPYLVHFPIALMLTALGFYVVFLFTKNPGFHLYAIYSFAISLISAFFAGISGARAVTLQTITDPDILHLIEQHEFYANLSIGGSILVMIVWAFGIKKFTMDSPFKWVVLLLLSGLAASVLYTGRLGGNLVYAHGVGVLQ